MGDENSQVISAIGQIFSRIFFF